MDARTPIVQRRLSRLPQHEVHRGEPDIRGWLLLGADGHRIGRVHDLVVCLESWRLRHVEIALDRGLAFQSGADRVVIPTACLELAPRRQVVHARRITTDEIVHAPKLGASPIGADEERLLCRFFRCVFGPQEMTRFWGIRRRGRESAPYVVARQASMPQMVLT
jgi:hypothetical protein